MYKTDEFMARFKSVGQGVQVFEHALILEPEKIELGDCVRIDDYCRIEGGNGVVIGDYTHIASFSSILAGGACQLGRFVGIAQGARLITGGGHPYDDYFDVIFHMSDLYFRKKGYIEVGDYGVVGANAVILPNIKLGEGAIAAAGTVITNDIRPWTIRYSSPGPATVERPRPGPRDRQTSRIYPYT